MEHEVYLKKDIDEYIDWALDALNELNAEGRIEWMDYSHLHSMIAQIANGKIFKITM